MKTSRNIFIAFILNLFFAIFEFIGGFLTNSVAIMSDSIHDIGDAFSIGISFFLEKKSHKDIDETHSFGYSRYSILGASITSIILLLGSIFVIYNAIERLFNPVDINYNGMLIFAIIGVIVNFVAAYFTKDGDNLNQKAVNLHMLEDVLGWVIVLIGSIIMKFTNINFIDSIMSLGVAIFILINAFNTFKESLNVLLEKVPEDVSIKEIKEHLLKIEGVLDISRIHIWSLDENKKCAIIHIIIDEKELINFIDIKKEIREELHEHNIMHTTIEIETKNNLCNEDNDYLNKNEGHGHHHHGHSYKHCEHEHHKH